MVFTFGIDFVNLVLKNWKWIALIVLILIVFIRVKVRHFFWKIRKTGEQLTFKQFLGRWKKGISGISPLQQTKSQLFGIWITLTGIISGIVVNLVVRLKNVWWWLCIILVGSLLLTLIQMIGFLQKHWILKRVDEEVKKLEDEH